jgi:hypothetical protein
LKGTWDAVYDADPEAQLFLSWMWMSKWLGDVIQPWIVVAARPEGGFDILSHFWALKWGGLFGRSLASVQRTDRTMLRHCFDEGALYMPVPWEGQRRRK